MEKIRKNKKTIILFLFPAVVLYLCFEVIPVVMSIFFSFNDWPGIQAVPLKFVGLENYRNLFQNAVFLKSLQNVFIYVIVSVLLQVPLGFGLGLFIHHFKRGQRFFKAAFFIPMILSVTAVALLWNFIYFPTEKGILNSLLIKIGLQSFTQQWLVNPKTSLLCLIIVSTWTSVGYYMIICLAGLTSVPESVMEAGQLDGATGWKKIRYLYIPMLWDPIKMSTIMVITGVLKIFDTVYILTPTGGTNNSTVVPALLMYNEAYRYGHYGTGSAIATVIFLLSALVSVFSLKLMNKRESIEY
ncbi:sugar ABC transporter permease [Blautia schinkii]|nr:sugar ABC transporter permease [Blautia schinkii]